MASCIVIIIIIIIIVLSVVGEFSPTLAMGTASGRIDTIKVTKKKTIGNNNDYGQLARSNAGNDGKVRGGDLVKTVHYSARIHVNIQGRTSVRTKSSDKPSSPSPTKLKMNIDDRTKL